MILKLIVELGVLGVWRRRNLNKIFSLNLTIQIKTKNQKMQMFQEIPIQ